MTPPRRFLQPGTLVPDASSLWVLDQLQPVGVVLDATTGSVLHHVAWGDAVAPAERTSFPDGWWGQVGGGGLLVQAPHRDGVVLVRTGEPAVVLDQPVLGDPHPRVRPFWVDGSASRLDWLTGPDTWAAGRRWRVGWSRADRSFPRPVHAVGEASDGDDVRRLIGHGAAITAVTHEESLWVAVESERLLGTYTRPVPIALVRLDARTGDVSTVLAEDAVDVADGCWPVLPEPPDPWAFAELWRDKVQLEAPWWSVTVSGRWPRTEVVVELPHPVVPDVRLRRCVPLYDELGRECPPQYVATHIEEHLATTRPPDVLDGVSVVDF